MAAPSPEMLAQATEVAERIATMGRDIFRGIWLTNWRGWRFVYDVTSPQQCNRQCVECRLFQLNEQLKLMEVGLPFKLSLYPWADQIDKNLYGPEPYLSCKTAMRQAQCFIVYILHHPECVGPVQIKDELELVRDLCCVYETGTAVGTLHMQQHIVKTVKSSLEWKRRQFLPEILRELGWDGKRFVPKSK